MAISAYRERKHFLFHSILLIWCVICSANEATIGFSELDVDITTQHPYTLDNDTDELIVVFSSRSENELVLEETLEELNKTSLKPSEIPLIDAIENATNILADDTDQESFDAEMSTITSTTQRAARRNRDCNKRWADLEFTIQHEGHPSKYSNEELCRYVVVKHSNDICAVEITFHEFDLEMSPSCKKDYFAIGDERLCGQISADSIVEYPFEDGLNEIPMVFKTNEAVTKGGFRISMKQVSECDNDLNAISAVHACDVLITDISGELVTHRGPESKEPACRYTIGRRHSGFCQVELDFIDFNVDYLPGCSTSYVQMDGHRFCGTALRGQRKNVTFDALGNVQLIYRTDTLRSDRGFHLLFRQIPCPPPGQPIRSPGGSDLIGERIPSSCNKVFYDKEFYLESPGFPNSYSNDLDCHIVIRKFRDSVCQLDIRFLDFDVESSPGCHYDYLQLDADRLCGRIPEDHVRALNFWGYEKVLRFRSDSLNTRPGYFLYIRQLDCSGGVPVPVPPAPGTRTPGQVLQCDSHLWGPDGQISSPNYPANYENNAHCRYTVHRIGDHICHLKMTFLDFRLQLEVGGCYRDFIEIDGSRICGDGPAGTMRTVDFRTPEKVITFTTDSWGSDAGFLLQLQQIPCGTRIETNSCDRVLQAPRFELRSDRYPQFYPSGLYCRYVIRRSSNDVCQLRIRFILFELEPSIGCSNDYLVLDGEKLCGTVPSNTTRNLRFNELEKIILFRTDGASEAPGFLASVEQLECPGGGPPRPPSTLPRPTSQPPTTSPHSSTIPSSGCNRHFTELRATISSPNFPSPYPSGVNCRYTVSLRPGYCQIEFTFVEFFLEQPVSDGFRCVADFLELGGGRYCGQQLHGITKIEPAFGAARDISLIFTTNGRIADKGFLTTYRQLPCTSERQPPFSPSPETHQPQAGLDGDPSCSQHHTGPSFEIRGPELGPGDYGQSLQCIHQVRRLGPYYCGLRVTFVTFDMGDGIDCLKHYLQIGDTSVCGNLPAYTIREYPFQDYSTVIRLTSSGLPRPRMFLRIEQTPCGPANSAPRIPPTCDETLLNNVFEIRSPYYPQGYDSRLDCRYIVRRFSTSVCRLELVFERFSLPTSQHCRLSYFRVDADTICGSLVPFTTRVYDFTSVEKLIHFQADHIVAGTGFLVRGRQVPCGAALETSPGFDEPGNSRTTDQPNSAPPSSIRCDQSFGLNEFTLFSPNHPEWYPSSVLCRYVVLRTDGDVCGLDVTFLNFDLEDYYHCQRDYLDIDGERLCGLLPPQSTRHYKFHPADRTKVLVFRSDHEKSRPGFALRIRQTKECQPTRGSLLTPSPGSPNPAAQITRSDILSREVKGCTETFVSTARGEIRSPGYETGMYSGSQHCVYTFVQRTGFCSISLHFRDFDLYPSADCLQDYLEIEGRRFCHQQLLQVTREMNYPWSGSSTLSLVFHSEKDRFLNRGFRADVEQIACPRNRQGRRRSDEDRQDGTNSTMTVLNRSQTDSAEQNWDDTHSDSVVTTNATSSINR